MRIQRLTIAQMACRPRGRGRAGRHFISPAATKFGQRAIPPSNLNTSDPRYLYDYHLYRVAKDITVCAGPAAPAFEQPVGAIQYATSSKVCPTIPFTTVADLVSSGALVRLQVPAEHDASPKDDSSAE